ncbi:MAG: shikimate kinase [Candidatus Atribacteria bacterium]|nr:shikimate kinase [Candidatus Atribacteria bacterium]
MGSGKTTIGWMLAEQLHWRFLDTDSLIEEQAGLSIPRLFGEYGEEYFRRWETRVLNDVARQEKIVLATGGGLPTREENWVILEKHFLTVFLRWKLDTLYERIKGDPERPLAARYPTLKELGSLYLKRLPFYERASVIIDGNGMTKEEIVGEIIKHAKNCGVAF